MVVGGVAGGALLLWLLVKWLDRDDTEAQRLRFMPYAAEGNSIGIAGEYSLGGAGRDRPPRHDAGEGWPGNRPCRRLLAAEILIRHAVRGRRVGRSVP